MIPTSIQALKAATVLDEKGLRHRFPESRDKVLRAALEIDEVFAPLVKSHAELLTACKLHDCPNSDGQHEDRAQAFCFVCQALEQAQSLTKGKV